MSEQIRQLVDLNDQALSQVRFGRSRFLRALGVTIFGLAVQMTMPRNVYAHHQDPSWPCYGYHNCSCCSGTTCCTGYGCGYWEWLGCPTLGQCWYTCAAEGYLYRCCDWRQKLPNGNWDPNPCICSSFVGSC